MLLVAVLTLQSELKKMYFDLIYYAFSFYSLLLISSVIPTAEGIPSEAGGNLTNIMQIPDQSRYCETVRNDSNN